MKLLLCTLEYPPQIGGVANYYENLIQAWPDQEAWMILDNNQNELLCRRGPYPWRKTIFSLYKQLAGHSFDLIFLGQILPLGLAALCLNIFIPFKFGVFLHGMDLTFALITPRKRFLAGLILKKSKIIVCANSKVRDILLDHWPQLKDRVVLINPGAKVGQADPVTQAQFRQRYQLTGKKILFSIGRLVKRKGFDQVIRALEGCGDQNFVYLLAGDGPEKDNLQALAAASAVAEKIIFTGVLTEAEKWSCLDLCDIFITTSRELGADFEGFGIVYLEANLMGKPVIAGRSGGVADAVIDNFNGLLVDPENINDISQSLKKLFIDQDLANKLGEQGRTRAQQDFAWSGQAEKLSQKLTGK